MDISSIMQNINEDYLLHCIPLSTLQTAEDVSAIPFPVPFEITEPDWKARFPRIDFSKMYLTPAHYGTIFYYDADKHILIDAIRLLLVTEPESAETYFLQQVQNVENEVANGQYTRAVRHLGGATMLHIARDIIASREPNPELYDLFLFAYTRSDTGSYSLPIDVVREVARGKNEGQRERTEKELAALPDAIPIYRGMGSSSTSLENAYSWSLSQRVACFFATHFCGDYNR